MQPRASAQLAWVPTAGPEAVTVGNVHQKSRVLLVEIRATGRTRVALKADGEPFELRGEDASRPVGAFGR